MKKASKKKSLLRSTEKLVKLNTDMKRSVGALELTLNNLIETTNGLRCDLNGLRMVLSRAKK